MLQLKHVTYSLKGRSLIQDISLSFAPGRLYGILGPNGSGKSTLLKTISGIWPASTGTVKWQDEELLIKPRQEISRLLTLVSQQPTLSFDFTVYELVAMGRYPHKRFASSSLTSYEKELIEKNLILVDGWHLKDQLMSNLSGGERQRMYIARALVTEAPILLLDEPTSYLDIRHQLEIWELLQLLVAQGKIVITTVHDLQACERFCDEVIVLHRGRCIATGTYESVMTPALLQQVFEVKKDVFFEIAKCSKESIL